MNKYLDAIACWTVVILFLFSVVGYFCWLYHVVEDGPYCLVCLIQRITGWW